MNDVLKLKCDLIEKNYKACRSGAKASMSQAVSLAALIYTAKNKLATEEEIRANRAILKEKTGAFSNLRGLTNLALLAKMSEQEDPGKFIENVIAAYDEIKGKVIRSEFHALAAQVIAENVDPENYADMADKTHYIWKKMQEKHPLLTNFDDFGIAAMLAVTDIDIDKQLEEAEVCYNLLKKSGFKLNKDALQTISHIMALSDEPIEKKTIRFAKIRDDLKAAKHPIRWEHLPIIAAFTGTDIPIDTIVEEICDADDMLKHKKGFGALACGRQLRRLYACALVLQTHEIEMEEKASKNASEIAQTTVENIIRMIIHVIIVSSIVAANNASHASSGK